MKTVLILTTALYQLLSFLQKLDLKILHCSNNCDYTFTMLKENMLKVLIVES